MFMVSVVSMWTWSDVAFCLISNRLSIIFAYSLNSGYYLGYIIKKMYKNLQNSQGI